MSRDGGYTATEALAALAILGLAIGGLTAGLQVLGRGQSAAGAALQMSATIRADGQELDRLLRGYGPFRSDRPPEFRGDASGFTFTCGARTCGVRILGQALELTGQDGATRTAPLPAAKAYAIAYVGSNGPSGTWPPVIAPPPAPQWEVLQSVNLTRDGQPFLAKRLWVQQAADCDFDTMTQDCRAVGP